MEKYIGKKILVVGLGLQGGGVGIAKYFADLGANVTVTDKKSEKQLSPSIEALKDYEITFHLGGHQQDDFLSADIIFKGPSVLWTTPEIVAAEKKGIPVEMELSFFAANFPGKIIGVTGTRGKSTTTSMIFNLLKLSNFPAFLGGGFPGISTINYLKTLKETDWVVAEISSWALSGFHRKKISPHIAVMTNIYPDHLNYYNRMDDYIYDKKAIFLYQKKDDYFILNESLQFKDIKSKNPHLDFTVSMLPQLTNAPRPVTGGTLYALSVLRASRAQPQAWNYIAYLTSPGDNARFVNDVQGVIPQRALLPAYDKEAVRSVFAKSMLALKIWNNPNPKSTRAIFSDMIENYALGKASLSDAIRQANTQLVRITPR